MTERAQLREKHEKDRKKYTDFVLNSTSHKIIIAAGPGTGKTYLFSEICKKKGGNILVLSFINELINDIKKELGEVAEIRTLHSFARKLLKADFYMKLTEIIEEDYSIYYDENISFRKIFSCLLPDFSKELEFYSARRKYYNYFGPFCSIYALIKLFEKNPEKIPSYSQILIDEFQDFNKLEMRLIDLLAIKSPVLIVGDDDQSLYTFKFAEPEGIRTRFHSGNYDTFELPYCSRCPEILVEATNKLIKVAQEKGLLNRRINKEYKYYCSDKKDLISNNNPKIIFQRPVYQKQVASALDLSIRAISEQDDNFSVLVICTLPNQIQPLANALRKKGFTNIETPPGRIDLTKREAYSMLLKDENSNLAWRILSSYIFSKEELKNFIIQSVEKKRPFRELFHLNKHKQVMAVLRVLKKIKNNKEIKPKEAELVFQELDYNPFETTIEKIKEEVLSSHVAGGGHKNISIKIVTMLGAKGLTRDYVFLVNCDDRFVLDNGIVTDDNICKFLVALTRAKKRFVIFSRDKKVPTFLQWIGPNFYEEIPN